MKIRFSVAAADAADAAADGEMNTCEIVVVVLKLCATFA